MLRCEFFKFFYKDIRSYAEVHGDLDFNWKSLRHNLVENTRAQNVFEFLH